MKTAFRRRGISSLLVMLLVFGLIPVQAYATDSSYEQEGSEAVDALDGIFSNKSIGEIAFSATTAAITSYVSGKAFKLVDNDSSKWVTAVAKGGATYAASVWTEGTSTTARAVYVGVSNNSTPQNSSINTVRVYRGGGANKVVYR